jgi:hypothetical protein
LAYDPTAEEAAYEAEEDDLGTYEDGVKRTLTHEQIELFRHSEIQQLLRAERLKQEYGEDATPVASGSATPATQEPDHPGFAGNEQRRWSDIKRKSSTPSVGAKRKREEHVPYYERHKRKWEAHVAKEDPTEGSITMNRLRREMDNKKAEVVELDY